MSSYRSQQVAIDSIYFNAIDLLATHTGRTFNTIVNDLVAQGLRAAFADDETMVAALTKRRKSIEMHLGLTKQPEEPPW